MTTVAGPMVRPSLSTIQGPVRVPEQPGIAKPPTFAKPSRMRGSQYAVPYRSITAVCEYWVTRFRG
jgi:hypothetical protein